MTLTTKLNVTKLHINSGVKCRFATTEINSQVENVSEKAEEAEFVANLPEGAFITYFEMEIDGKVIVGDVKEKQQAKADYDAAKSRGETAGHVAQAPRETSTFNISVNIAPYNSARFKLVYQELLQRVRGAYKHQINVHPGQAVDDLQVNVTINESSPISIIHVPTFAAKLSDKSNKELLLLKEASDVRIEKVSDTEMTVKWHPSAANQTQYLTNDVLDGQLIVLYDVDRNDDQVLVVDGHFIHFFAPKNLDIGSKNIVFALDISGSMDCGKLGQTKTAMRSILNQLRETDQFSILCFNTELKVWKKKPMPAKKENISEAIGFIDAQHPGGGTDIDLAVQEGIKWLKGSHSKHILANILVLLTDGEHNSGQYKSHQIISRILEARRDGGQHIKVYGLGFGNDADFNLLREMSSKTGGFARRIYAASDAAIQLDSFYAEISSPLLADLDIKYLNPNVEVVSTVKNITGDTLFEGSEFVVIGKMNQLSLNEGDKIFEWRARSCHGPKVFKCCYRPWRSQRSSNKGDISNTAGGFIERSWAYLTVKNLLEKAKVNSEESAALNNQALKLALEFKFVTEQTSMVVTQTEKAVELEQIDHLASSAGHAVFMVPMMKCSSNEKRDIMGRSTVCCDEDEVGSVLGADNDSGDLKAGKVLAELPKRQRGKKTKTHMQLNNLVGRVEKHLNKMCDDLPPTVVEKLINTPIDSAIAAFNKLNDIQSTTSIDDNGKENRLLSLIATMVASKLSNSPTEKDLLKSLLEKSPDEIRIREVNKIQYVVECDVGQLATVPSILMAIHWKIRLNQLCGIETQNLLIQFLSVIVGTELNYSPLLTVATNLPVVFEIKVNNILTVAIAIDRLVAVRWPIIYKKRPKLLYVTGSIAVGCSWGAVDAILLLTTTNFVPRIGCAAAGCFASQSFRNYKGIADMCINFVAMAATITLLLRLRRLSSIVNPTMIAALYSANSSDQAALNATSRNVLVFNASTEEEKFKNANRIVASVLLISGVCIFLPSLFAGIGEMFHIGAFQKAGPFVAVGLLLSGCLNAVVYGMNHSAVKKAQEERFASPALVREVMTPRVPTDLPSLAKYLCQNVLYHQRGSILIVNKPYGVSSVGYRQVEGRLFPGDKHYQQDISGDPRESEPQLSVQAALPYLAEHFREPELTFATGVKRYLSGPAIIAANEKVMKRIKASLQFASSRTREDGGNIRILALCVGRPYKNEGELFGTVSYLTVNGKTEYIFTEGTAGSKRDRVTKSVVVGSCRYRVVASALGCSLIDLRVCKFTRHLPRLMLTHLCCPVLGDEIYQRRVARIFEKPILVEPKNASFARQFIPMPLVRTLGISINDYLHRLPMFMHVYQLALPKFGGKNFNLLASAPLPTHFVAMIECLGLSDTVARYLGNDTDDGNDDEFEVDKDE
uniref:Inter-alpha-trypsin inhibitor heavy chain H3 n=1 Tax=Plectus sambesii TaxID=2011161 RepID=A0A914UZC7_9BILA